MASLVERKLGTVKVDVYVEDPQPRGPSKGLLYDLRKSPHIDNR